MATATLTEAQARQAAALTAAYKAQQNRDAAKLAALIALYYRTRVNVEDPKSVQDWLEIMVPRLIQTSDAGALRASSYFENVRRLEVPGAPTFVPSPAIGQVDSGVAKSLLMVGPYDYMNKMREIKSTEGLSKQQEKALLVEAKQVTAAKIGAAVVRHAQAGGRQTIHQNSERDEVALGWVRVTRANPCYFCAALASRGLRYRAFSEGSFDQSDARFTGDGDAKVHDSCGCSMKPVYFKDDLLVKKTDEFADLWSRWGAGGGRDSMLRFRRGYEHWQETGDFLTWEQAAAA